MEKLGNKVLIFTVCVLVVFRLDVQGGRVFKEKHEVVQPQNIPGGGGIIGTPFPFPFAGAGGAAAGFNPFGSTVCSWPGLGCVPVLPLFPRGPSVPIGAGNTPLTVTATATATASP